MVVELGSKEESGDALWSGAQVQCNYIGALAPVCWDPPVTCSPSPALVQGLMLLANESHVNLFLAVFIQLLCY